MSKIWWKTQPSTYFSLCVLMPARTLSFHKSWIWRVHCNSLHLYGPGTSEQLGIQNLLLLCNGGSEHLCPLLSHCLSAPNPQLVIFCDTLQMALLFWAPCWALHLGSPRGKLWGWGRGKGLILTICSSLLLQGQGLSLCELFLFAWGFCNHHPSKTPSWSSWGAFL